jgi:hypothetical protein
MSTLLHATVYLFLHNLLNVLVQIANKVGLQNKSVYVWKYCIPSLQPMRESLRTVAFLIILITYFYWLRNAPHSFVCMISH